MEDARVNRRLAGIVQNKDWTCGLVDPWTRGLVDCVFLILQKCEKSTAKLEMNSIFVLFFLYYVPCRIAAHCHQKERKVLLYIQCVLSYLFVAMA